MLCSIMFTFHIEIQKFCGGTQYAGQIDGCMAIELNNPLLSKKRLKWDSDNINNTKISSGYIMFLRNSINTTVHLI